MTTAATSCLKTTRKPSRYPALVRGRRAHQRCLTSSPQSCGPAAWTCPAPCLCRSLGSCSRCWALAASAVEPPPPSVRWNEVSHSPLPSSARARGRPASAARSPHCSRPSPGLGAPSAASLGCARAVSVDHGDAGCCSRAFWLCS